MALRCFLPWTARLTRAMGRSFPCEGGERGLRRSGGAGRSDAEQLADLLRIAAGDLGLATEAAGPHARLLLEDVGAEGLAAHDLAGAGDLEALGGASVGLHLGHRVTPASATAGRGW